MRKVRIYIKDRCIKFYYWAFPVHELFYNQKKVISHIIKKYKMVDYAKQAIATESMGEYTRGLLSLLMETKTFNFIFVRYLRSFIYPEIQEAIYDTEETQRDLLCYIISTTKHTVFGKEHKFATYGDHVYANFIRHVPVVTYDQYKEWIERAKKESDIIWPWKITRFSASAGTTSRKKHIPVTDESLESINKAGLDTFATYATKYPETQAFGAYCRPLGGTIQEQLEDESIIGDVSALMILERSRMLQKKYKYPLEVFLEPNRYTKRDLFLQKLRPQEHTMMLGVTSRINEMLQYMSKKSPKKFASFIKNLKLIVWWWVSARPYINYFNQLGISHIWVYNASEGYFGYQDLVHYENDKAQAPYQLIIQHGVFYEFIPFTADNFDQWQLKATATVKPLREISAQDIADKMRFALVITTNSGLFRYLMGDVIRFVDQERRFEIVGRTKECINLKGEELMEDHINIALQKINERYHADFSWYTVGPDHNDSPQKHEWIIESVLPKTCSLDILTKEFDGLLQEANADYESKRKNDILLKMPLIHIVAPGTFHKWIKMHNKSLWWQTKIPKLSSERKIIEEVLSLVK